MKKKRKNSGSSGKASPNPQVNAAPHAICRSGTGTRRANRAAKPLKTTAKSSSMTLVASSTQRSSHKPARL